MKKKRQAVVAQHEMTGMSVLDQVRMVVAEQKRLAMDAVERQAVLAVALCCDHLDRVEIQMELERLFGITLLPDVEVDGCRTVGELADLVEKYAGRQREGAVPA